MLNRSTRFRKASIAIAGYLAALSMGGCTSGNLLNPSFLAALGGGQQAASLPGEAPVLVLEVENSTTSVIEFLLTWRDGEGEVSQRSRTLLAGEKFAEAVICPVEEVTLGDISNLDATGAIVRLGNGNPEDPFVEVEAFGVLLQEFVNFNCGDSVTFEIRPSSATLSEFRIFAFFQSSGLVQP